LTKQVMSISLDENIIGTINTLSTQKGISKSNLVERLLSVGLKTDSDLTPEQRYHFGRCVFVNRCSDVLKLHGIVEHEGGICDKFRLIVALGTSICTQKNRQSRNAIYELSIFELLNDIGEFDKEIFKECVVILNKNRNLSDKYFNLYPENKS